MRCRARLLVMAISCALAACSEPTTSPTAPSIPSAAPAAPVVPPATTIARAQPELAPDPAQLTADLVADEQALRDPSSSEAVLAAAARRQQASYRVLARHPEWEPIARPLIPPELVDTYDRNIDARVQLDALVATDLKDTLPAWRIDPPTPADELLDHYREAQAATGVDWNYLAAVNMIETLFGRVVGLSDAGAQGPMQFLPSTFAAYGDGGDILSPRDAIMAAGRYLAANGFADDRDRAIFRYNNSDRYVQAVDDYAAVLATDAAAFAGYHRWNVYYQTTSGDVLLPVGYLATSPIPVNDYLATHPQ